MKKKTIAVIFGTRPDTIKMAPIILRLKEEQELVPRRHHRNRAAPPDAGPGAGCVPHPCRP